MHSALVSLVARAAAGMTSFSHALQTVLSADDDNPLYSYPTDLTQGILPKAFHSHNDYWRPKPFWSALSVGAVSVEADVWLYNDTLHVGHEESALTNERTFDALYIQPILEVLRKQNPDSPFVTDGPTKNGVFDTASGQTLYLFVDVKTDGAETWPYVVNALGPLREAGYLTTYNGSTVTESPVTVIGTGNTPLDLVQGVSPRDYFWDAPIPTLDTTFSNITKDVSPIASTDFASVFGDVRSQELNETQAATLKAQVAAAHAKGIAVRYWDQPGWPVGTRNAVWRQLWDAGVDLLNVDDLEAAAEFWEGLG
ncbi:PLC-like phosphodiesterase [Xylariaceae sp. FL0016]|nr:PLC-like phosphodiesterase [Xylariaceae sp. FL0016]